MENIQIQQNKLKTALKLGLKKYHRLKLFEKIVLEHPKNITLVNNILSFDKVEGAKFYIIYKNKEEIKFTTDEIVDIIGDPEKKSRIDWTDKDKTNDKLDVELYHIQIL